MKFIIPLLSLFASCCVNYESKPGVYLSVSENEKKQPNPGSASSLIRSIQNHNQGVSDWYVQKIKDTYLRVVTVLEEQEAVNFSLAFFKALASSENLNYKISTLYNTQDELPNTEALKFFYKSEKELNKIINSISKFSTSPNPRVQYCAAETEKYFQYQKELFIAIRDVDYQTFETSEIPFGIPSEVLRANAKFMEQQDQMATCLISFYASLAE